MKRFSLQATWGDQSGNILILAGLGFFFLFGIGGAAYDLGHQQLVQQRMQQAADAAALAAGGMEPGTTDAARTATANALFKLNYPTTFFGVAQPTPIINVTSTDVTVSVAPVPVRTAFVSNFGIRTLDASGRSVVQIRSDTTKIDVILVMDNSGSMASTDVGAGSSLDAAPGVRTQCVNGWIAYFAAFGATLSAAGADTVCNTWEGATGFTRLNALRYSATQLTDDLMNPNPLDHRMALVTWDYFVMNSQDFSDDPTLVKNYLNTMYGRGATDSTKALLRAQTLAAGFRSDAAHAVVLMTDGVNGHGGVPPSTPAEIAAFNTSSLAVCSALKAMPKTVIFTIGFGSEVLPNPVTQQFLSDCASPPNGSGDPKPNANRYYYPVSDAAGLAAAFKSIEGVLKKVRVVQ